MQHIHTAQTKGFDHDTLVAHGRKHVKNSRIQTGGQLQQENIAGNVVSQHRSAGISRQYPLVHYQAQIADLGSIAGIDTLKGGKTGSPDLYRPAAQHHLPVKGQKHTVITGGRHGKGGAQILGPIGKHIRQGQLGAGKHHRNVDIRQHKGNRRSGISHGVGTVGYHDSVEAFFALKNLPGDQLPFLGADVGGVQTHNIPDGNIVIGSKLIQLPLHDTGTLGFQAVAAGQRRNGTAGGQQQDFLFIVHGGFLPVIP